MLTISMFVWWYSEGWTQVFGSLNRRLRKTLTLFSVGTLIRTLFAPWRRIMSAPAKGIRGHLYAALDNLVSRCVGFVVRFFVLLAGLIMLALVATASILEIIIWPLLPVTGVVCLVLGIAKL